MKKYTNYRDLYRHIVRSFYLGEYRKGDRFPTQVELVSIYHVAANSIKKIFKLLLDDGFITTERSFGTHVTFDLENPEHVAKVPLYCPDPQGDDVDTLKVPAQFVAYTLCHGMMMATPEKTASYIIHLEEMLARMQQVRDLACLNNSLFAMMCSDIDNQYLMDFGEYLMHDYIFIRRQAFTDSALCDQVIPLATEFYSTLLQALRDGKPEVVVELFPIYYTALYRIPGLFVFAIPERKQRVFVHHALYTQLMHKLLLFIVSSDLKKGDMLPTEQEIATQYGVSIITVRKALSMLKEIGLLDGERFVGTRMQEDWNSPMLQEWLSDLLEQQHKMISDSILAEYVLGQALQHNLQNIVDDNLVDAMQQALDIQWEAHLKYNAPLFMSQVFSTPIVARINSPLLNRCFFHVHDDLTKFLAIRLLQMSQGFGGTAGVHAAAQQAIDALRRRDFAEFIEKSDAAVLRNRELMRNAIDDTVYRCGNPVANR